MEELLGRQVPHSETAEQAVIGSMLIDTRCIPDVIERLRSAEFYGRQNRDIFDTVYAMFSYGQTIDPVTILDQMKVRGVYTEQSPAYIAELMRVTPTAANVLEYAAIVRSRFGDEAFPGMLDFAREVRKYVPNVVMTTVETTISHEDEAACQRICDELGVRYRIRAWVNS